MWSPVTEAVGYWLQLNVRLQLCPISLLTRRIINAVVRVQTRWGCTTEKYMLKWYHCMADHSPKNVEMLSHVGIPENWNLTWVLRPVDYFLYLSFSRNYLSNVIHCLFENSNCFPLILTCHVPIWCFLPAFVCSFLLHIDVFTEGHGNNENLCWLILYVRVFLNSYDRHGSTDGSGCR